MSSIFIDTREIVERVKDYISKDIDGFVYDYHVADVLDMQYSTLRINIMKNNPPVTKVVIFCHKNSLEIDHFLFDCLKK